MIFSIFLNIWYFWSLRITSILHNGGVTYGRVCGATCQTRLLLFSSSSHYLSPDLFTRYNHIFCLEDTGLDAFCLFVDFQREGWLPTDLPRLVYMIMLFFHGIKFTRILEQLKKKNITANHKSLFLI